MERRKSTLSKSSSLPDDYLKMVCEVFSNHFDTGLKKYCALKPNSHFEAFGAVYADEVILAVSLMTDGVLAATTVTASSDFDPKASAPGMQELLSACVDAIGAVFEPLFQVKQIENLANESLSALEKAPFEWTVVEADKRKIYVKIDKSNPKMDAIVDSWLSKNDPNAKAHEAEEQKKTESLFVTGPKKRSE